MNAEQKRAWLMLISFVVCGVLFAVLAPFVGAQAAIVAFAPVGLNAFGVLIGRGEKVDERDKSILRRAALAGFAASYLIFVLALMGMWTTTFMFHGSSQVSVHVLPDVVTLGFFTALIVRAVAVLVGYRRHVEADDV
jgi:hypothetical protein